MCKNIAQNRKYVILLVTEDTNMLLSLKVNNCMIFNQEVEFSMQANMHYKKFSSNLFSSTNINVLKSAIIYGPNNSGKTNFVKIIRTIKGIMLNQGNKLIGNIFNDDHIIDCSISFLDNDHIYSLTIKYDESSNEYIYERFSELIYDKNNHIRTEDWLLRDVIKREYRSKDRQLTKAMKIAAKNNLLIYLIDTSTFEVLNEIKNIIVSFASKIDVIDMNNVPIGKTIEMLKKSESEHKKIADFVLNSDLYMDDYKYISDDELRSRLTIINNENNSPQENVLKSSASFNEMMHLVSVYKGVMMPSLFYDSTGTKKMAALASYVIDALENDRILIVDELDNSLHFRLTRAIIAMFNNELNIKAQLIATVHDISLLDCQKLFRKEQIWFTHKNTEGVYLYSLADFTAKEDGIRDTSDLIKKYKEGIFGALPEPDLFKSLLEATHHE